MRKIHVANKNIHTTHTHILRRSHASMHWALARRDAMKKGNMHDKVKKVTAITIH